MEISLVMKWTVDSDKHIMGKGLLYVDSGILGIDHFYHAVSISIYRVTISLPLQPVSARNSPMCPEKVTYYP